MRCRPSDNALAGLRPQRHAPASALALSRAVLLAQHTAATAHYGITLPRSRTRQRRRPLPWS